MCIRDRGGAALECAGLDVAHAQGDVDLGQGGAAVEGAGLDVLYTVGDVHGRQGLLTPMISTMN